MSDINNNEPERFFTANNALALFKRLQIEDMHGSELPLEMSEYLDSTWQHMNSKKGLQDLKNRSPSAGTITGTKQHQINQELIPELKKWKTDTHQVITFI